MLLSGESVEAITEAVRTMGVLPIDYSLIDGAEGRSVGEGRGEDENMGEDRSGFSVDPWCLAASTPCAHVGRCHRRKLIMKYNILSPLPHVAASLAGS